MEIDIKYVCGIDQAKRLYEFGLKKNSLFVWVEGCITKGSELHARNDFSEAARVPLRNMDINLFPAYTLQELYEIMEDLYMFNQYFSSTPANYDPKITADFIIKKLEER